MNQNVRSRPEQLASDPVNDNLLQRVDRLIRSGRSNLVHDWLLKI